MADYTKALELSPHHVKALTSRGRLRSTTGDLDGALADFDQVIELSALTVEAWDQRGQIRSRKEDWPRAIADYSRAIEIDPRSGKAYVHRGTARKNAGDLEKAMADFTTAMELDPLDAEARVDRGIVLAMQGKWEQARDDFADAARAEPRDLYPLLYRTVAQMRLGSDTSKEELANSIMARTEVKSGTWASQLADFLLGRLDEATLFSDTENPDEQTARGRRCEAWYFTGMTCLTAGQTEEAERRLRECLATKQKSFREYQMAQSELSRLESAR